jgi:hypothetical protein
MMRRPRAVTPAVQARVEQMWGNRLAITAAPDLHELMRDPQVADPLGAVGQAAMGLHQMLEAPEHQRRQSRATLEAMAMLALRRAE